MTNQYFYQPQVIYTRLKDIFNEDKNEDIEDFSSSNFIKPNSIKKAIQSKENKNNKLKNNIITEDKKSMLIKI